MAPMEFQVSVTGVSTVTLVALAVRVVGVFTVMGTTVAAYKVSAPLPQVSVNK
jgi:hypothetical protein